MHQQVTGAVCEKKNPWCDPCYTLSAVQAKGKICLSVASSGIASLLLEGSQTAHSTFRIPLAVNDTSTCNITHHSHLYHVLQQTSLIIWDEVPMQHKHAIEAVDRTLQDFLGKTLPLVASLCSLVVISDKPYLSFLMVFNNSLFQNPSEEATSGIMSRCIIYIKICVWNSPQRCRNLLHGS